MAETFKVNYKGKTYDINLFWQIQKELLEKDYNWNLYINIALVREIARQLWRSISEIKTSVNPLWLKDKFWNDLVHTHCEARVYIPDVWIKDNDWNTISKELHWVSDDLYKVDWLSRSCFPNMARVQALAVKNALKRAFPFFEADYLQAEDLAERWIISNETANDVKSSQYNVMASKIKEAEKKVDLSLLAWEIKKAYDEKKLSGEEFKWLKALYSEKYNSLWQ